ncbi:hypothetical protein C0993_005264 [Termitomyces sp. T159_Od127]|nr:hypothetical protein C0993_005264 [Termitomyces sp. T159_Od127]
MRYTVNELHQLVQNNLDLSAYTLGTFLTYYHEFQKISRWLLQHSKIHANEERHLFQQGIPTLLWAKITRHREVLKLTHHLEDPYDVKDVYEAGNWHLKDTDTSLGIPHAKAIMPVLTQPQVANNTVTTDSYIKKEDMEATISAAVASTVTHIETMINTQLSTPRTPNAANKRHSHNPGNVATDILSSNANPNADQHVQQQLIHEVLHLDSVHKKGGLSKESHIAALEMKLNALKDQVFDGVEILRSKQALKGYKPMATVANNHASPAPETSSTPPSAAPVNNMPPLANAPSPLPPLHPYSGLNNHYQPPAQQNFGAPNK